MGRDLTKQEALSDGLVVTVSGRPNRGKTTVARLIEEMLRREGFTDVSVFDDPKDSGPNKAPIDLRIEATKKRTIYIETVQAWEPAGRSIAPGEVPMAED